MKFKLNIINIEQDITGRRFEKLQETASDFTDRIFPIAADSTKKEDIKSEFGVCTVI